MSANDTNYELLQIREALANLPSLLSSAISTTSGAFQVYMAAGWSPVLGLADDGTYYYIQVKDWVGGTGTMPLVGQYLSTSGWTNNIASASRIALVGGGIPDGDKGDIVVSSSGTVWTVDGRAITAPKLFEVGANKLLGRHTGTSGDVQEISIGGGLEFSSSNLRRSALTGDVTASAGSNSTTITPAADPSWITSLALNKLTQSGATTGQVAQWNGTAWVPAASSSISGFTLDTATYSSQTFARVLVNDAATNVNVVFRPKGNGYFSLLMPDGTTTGGNQRGQFAVDLNTRLTAADFIASGAGSFGAGYNGRASGAGAFCFSGVVGGATASGVTALAFGGNASGVSAISLGIGSVNQATGDYSVALGGYDCRASGYDSFAHGFAALANKRGQRAHSTGSFSAQGDAQLSDLLARNSTGANSTPVTLFLDGSSARITIPANTAWAVDVTIIARTTTAGAAYAVFRRQCIVWRGVAVGTTVCSTSVTIGTDQGSNAGTPPAGWAVALTADTTNGALDIQCTGSAAAGAARWVAQINLTEVTYA